MEKLFDSHEIDDLKQQVEKLESSSQQEDLAVDMLLLLSMKLRGTFPTPAMGAERNLSCQGTWQP